MDPTYPPEAEAFRERVQAFLAEHLPVDWHGIGVLDRDEVADFTASWRVTLARHGYLAPSWPQAYGGLGMSALEQVILAEEFQRAGVPTGGSVGHLADWIFVLTRTDPDVAKHKGITFLLCPMGQPGVEVRPISMMSGESEFNEVFPSDARCPKGNVIGEVNGGWAVAMTLLGYERGEAAATFPLMFYAGSSEIQGNILGEMVLGPPKEPKAAQQTWREQQAGTS